MSENQKPNPFSFDLPSTSTVDVDKLRPIYGLQQKNKGPDYIPYNARGRDTMGRLSFNTGVVWVVGYTFGGLRGAYHGLKRTYNSPSLNIRANAVMNGIVRQGTPLSTTLATLVFMHTLSVGFVDLIELEQRLGNPAVTPVCAGLMTGFLYRVRSGPRAALLASTIGMVSSCVYWFAGGHIVSKYISRGGRL
eukprot:gene36446-47454_t